jgi:HK97 family phage major capsid protein
MDINMDTLNALEVKLKGATALETKALLTGFKESFDAELKAKENALEAKSKTDREAAELEVKTLRELQVVQQEHLDKLDLKLKSNSGNLETKTFSSEVRSLVKDNFEAISLVRKGHSVELELKAVGNMTTANITGDLERDFSNIVAMVPNQKVAFSDLISAITISGGTYTFPREGAGEGAMATQTEGASKAQRDYDFTHIDVVTDFIAGFARWSKKMQNNALYLQSFLPQALMRDYMKAESTIFNTALAAVATASVQIITGKNKSEMLMNEIATLEALDFDVNAIVLTTADYYSILQIEKSTGAGYGLPLGWSYDGNVLRCLGIAVVKANWLAANKYYVGDWSTISKVVTEGLSIEFSSEDGDNFTKNNVTGRIEAQVGLAVHRPDAVIYGDFTAV